MDASKEQAAMSEPISEVERLREELRKWETWNIVEIAVRNRQVAEYCEHWEGRATKAEAELSRVRAERAEIAKACEWREHGLTSLPEHVAWLRDEYKEMCGRLRVEVESRKLGLGGEKLDTLVIEALRAAESALAEARAALRIALEYFGIHDEKEREHAVQTFNAEAAGAVKGEGRE